MKPHALITRLLTTATAVSIAVCALTAGALAESYRLGSGLPADSPPLVAAKQFADLLRERTKGEVDISIFPDSQLGNDEDLARDLSRGALDFGFVQQGSLGGLNKALEFGHMAYLVTSPEQAEKVIYSDGIVRKSLSELLASYKMRLLAFYELESRAMSNSLRPIKSVEDMKGLRIRVPPSNSLRAFVTAVGAQPVTVPFAEIFGALQQGLVDGQENGPTLLYTSRVFEAQKYLTLLEYQYSFGSIIISEATWAKLSPELQKIVQDTANEISVIERDLARKARRDSIDKLKASGMAVIEYEEIAPEELKKFQDIGRGAWDKLTDVYGAERIQALRNELATLEK